MSRSMRFSNEQPRVQTQPLNFFTETQEIDSSLNSTCRFAQIDDFDGLSFGEILLQKNNCESGHPQQKTTVKKTGVDIFDFSFGQCQQEGNQIKCIPYDGQKILEVLQKEKTKQIINVEKNCNDILKGNQNISQSDDIESVEAEDIIHYMATQQKSANLERLLNKMQRTLASHDLSMTHSQIIQKPSQNMLKQKVIKFEGQSINLNRNQPINLNRSQYIKANRSQPIKYIPKFVKQRKLTENVKISAEKQSNKFQIAHKNGSTIKFIGLEDSESSYQRSLSTNLTQPLINLEKEYFKKLNFKVTYIKQQDEDPRERRKPVKYWLGEKVSYIKEEITMRKQMKQIEDYFSKEQQMLLSSYKTIRTSASKIQAIIIIKINYSITLTLGGFSLVIITKGKNRVQQVKDEILLKSCRKWKRRVSLHKRNEIVVKNDCGAECEVTLRIYA